MTMQILFFSLIPFGIILLIFSIKLIHNTFSGTIVHEVPYSLKSSEFDISAGGYYSVWHKGPFFRKAPVADYKPVVTNASTGENIRLTHSIFRPNSNYGRSSRMELYRFYAPGGRYIFNLAEGSSITKAEKKLIDLIPAKKVDPDRYFIQVRESQPGISVVIGILLIIVSGFCLIGGLVFGILARQIFNS